MEEVCMHCGERLGGYFDVKIGNKSYKLCEKCNIKYRKGEINEIDMLQPGEVEQKNKQLNDNEEIRKNNALYNDVHQIAGDLRFLKNLVIVLLVISIVMGILAFMLPIFI